MTAIVTKIETLEITIPLPKPLLLGAMPIVARQYAIVRVYDNEGNFGVTYGLTRGAPIAATMERLIAPRWVNQKLENHDQFYENTVAGNHFMGTHGIFWRALSLADCALHDLLAKRAGKSLCEYLGGSIKPVQTMVAGCYPTSDETETSLIALMQHMVSYGAAGIKITSSTDYVRDTARLAICRRAIPDGPPFVNDLYCMVKDIPALIEQARRWTDFRMLWVEDPLPFDDIAGVATIANALPYAVGVGDEQASRLHFERLMDQGQIGVLRLDATVCGGVRAFVKIAAAAAQRGIPVSCHIFHHLHAQLAAAIPNVQWIEYMLPETNVESIHLLWNSDLQWENGRLVPSALPGIGCDWNTEAIEYYRLQS